MAADIMPVFPNHLQLEMQVNGLQDLRSVAKQMNGIMQRWPRGFQHYWKERH